MLDHVSSKTVNGCCRPATVFRDQFFWISFLGLFSWPDRIFPGRHTRRIGGFPCGIGLHQRPAETGRQGLHLRLGVTWLVALTPYCKGVPPTVLRAARGV